MPIVEPYIGEVKTICGEFIPSGWLLCDGREVKINDYEILYNLIGTAYGGNGIDSFALPDLRGRAPIHFSNNYKLGSKGGSETATINTDQLPAHGHTAYASGNTTPNSSSPSNSFWSANSKYFMWAAAPGDIKMNPANTQNTGGNEAHENRIPFIALNYIIAWAGIAPPRG